MFVVAVLDSEKEILVVYVMFLTISNKIYTFRRAWIVSLKLDKASITVLLEYSNFIDIISSELIAELPKHIEINHYSINLADDKKP